MMFDDDQMALRDVARRFAREKLRPDYQKRESQPGIDRALFKEMGSLGLIGVDLPEEYGGLGLSGVTAGIFPSVQDARETPSRSSRSPITWPS